MPGMAYESSNVFIRPHWNYSKEVSSNNISWVQLRRGKVNLQSANSLWKAHQIVPVVFSENAKRWSQATQATTKAAQHSIRSENLQHPTNTIGQDWSI